MTNKIEYGVEYDGFNEVFEAFRSDEDGGEWLGDFKTYDEAFTHAYQAALKESAADGNVVFPEWDPELACAGDDDLSDLGDGEEPDEDEAPTFPPGTHITGEALVADLNGDLWWANSYAGTLKRATVTE